MNSALSALFLLTLVFASFFGFLYRHSLTLLISNNRRDHSMVHHCGGIMASSHPFHFNFTSHYTVDEYRYLIFTFFISQHYWKQISRVEFSFSSYECGPEYLVPFMPLYFTLNTVSHDSSFCPELHQ